MLHAYDATNLATELYNSNQAANSRDHFGTGNKFIVPTVVNGKVYVGTTTGVGVFGLLCSYAIAPAKSIFSAAGGTGNIVVTASSGCPWSAASNAAWITVSGNTYSVAPNPSPEDRVGTISIAGRIFEVTESGNSPKPKRPLNQ